MNFRLRDFLLYIVFIGIVVFFASLNEWNLKHYNLWWIVRMVLIILFFIVVFINFVMQPVEDGEPDPFPDRHVLLSLKFIHANANIN